MLTEGGAYAFKRMQVGATATGNGNSMTPLTVNGGSYALLTAQVVGITSATITWEGTIDEENWVALPALNVATRAISATATADGIYRLVVTSLVAVRARVSTYGSGTIYVYGLLTAAGEPGFLAEESGVTDHALLDNLDYASAGHTGFEEEGTAAAAIVTHVGLSDPHTQYALESTLGTAALLNVGTGANNIVQLNGSAQLPAVDGSLLTGISGGSGSPGGSNTQVQFNDGGAFGGDAGLTYNKTTDALTVTGSVNAQKVISGTGTGGVVFLDAGSNSTFCALGRVNGGYNLAYYGTQHRWFLSGVEKLTLDATTLTFASGMSIAGNPSVTDLTIGSKLTVSGTISGTGGNGIVFLDGGSNNTFAGIGRISGTYGIATYVGNVAEARWYVGGTQKLSLNSTTLTFASGMSIAGNPSIVDIGVSGKLSVTSVVTGTGGNGIVFIDGGSNNTFAGIGRISGTYGIATYVGNVAEARWYVGGTQKLSLNSTTLSLVDVPLRAGLQSSTTADQDAGRLVWSWVTATHASRASRGKLTAYYTSTEQTAMTWDGDTGGLKLAFYGGTPVAKAAAYTQTYSTADRTLSAYTADDESGAYTGIDNAQAGSVYAQLTDLNALRAATENLRAFVEDLAGVLNSHTDDLQALNLVG